MSDSDSSEDMPLSALGRNKKEESSEEEEFNDEESDSDNGGETGGDEPDSDDFIVEDSDEDDDDDGDYASDSSDDAPISSLKSAKKKTTAKKAKTPAKKSSTTKKAAPKKKATSAKKKTTKKSPKSKASSTTSSSSYLCASGELYASSEKGKLIQSLLARWWYAYEWPDPSSLPDTTPKGYDALDGFPGVYICTQGGEVGKFLDYRDHTQSPSFNNFAKKSSEELQGMLLKAIDAQMKVLIEHEGAGTDTEKSLKVLEKWANKLNCKKADKDAEKVLKAKRLKIS